MFFTTSMLILALFEPNDFTSFFSSSYDCHFDFDHIINYDR